MRSQNLNLDSLNTEGQDADRRRRKKKTKKTTLKEAEKEPGECRVLRAQERETNDPIKEKGTSN